MGGTGDDKLTIDPQAVYLIDGEEVTGDELLKGVMRQQDYTRKTQEIAPLRRAMEEWGFESPEDFVNTVAVTFGAVEAAREAGVQFNPDGTVTLPEPQQQQQTQEGEPVEGGQPKGPDPAEAAIAAIQEQLRAVSTALGGILTRDLMEAIREKYPTLDDEAVQRVVSYSLANPSADPFQEAEWLAQRIQGGESEKRTSPLPGGGATGTSAIDTRNLVFGPPQGEDQKDVFDAIREQFSKGG